MPDIVVTEFMDEAALDLLRADFDVVYDAALVDKPEELAALLPAARALIVRNRTQVRGCRACSRCEAGSGWPPRRRARQYRRGRLQGARHHGVSGHGCHDVSVAEYVVCGAMMLLRGAYFASAEVADGAWPRNRLMGREVMGHTLGLVGFGSIARETAKRARALGMTILAHDPFLPDDHPAFAEHGATPLSLNNLLAQAEAISLHVPLTDTTRGLIGADALGRMRKDAVLINAARGGVVDEAALAEALKAGRIAGAMLDVFDREPLPGGGPLVGVPNLILTPHIAGVTVESNVRVSGVIAQTVSRLLKERA